jgi:hypothetical protein
MHFVKTTHKTSKSFQKPRFLANCLNIDGYLRAYHFSSYFKHLICHTKGEMLDHHHHRRRRRRLSKIRPLGLFRLQNLFF